VAKLPDDEMILHYYGEHHEPEEVERALALDPELRHRYEALVRELGALSALEPPEPRAGIEGRMWARIAPELARPRRSRPWRSGWTRWAAFSTAVVVVGFAAFLAGRFLRPPREKDVAAALEALPPEARHRVLEAALAAHLDSSERFLVEVSNGAAAAEDERRLAGALLASNRLYRRAAERAGQWRVAAVLSEIEPLLTQLANPQPPGELRAAGEQIERTDLLFKVRVTRNNLKEIS